MNITDISCGIAFTKGLKGPIDFAKLEHAFRVKKFGFAISSSTVQHVGGSRHSGGRIQRGSVILVLPADYYPHWSSAASVNVALGDATIVIAHNDKGGDRKVHMKLVFDSAAIDSLSTITGAALNVFSVSKVAKLKLNSTFNLSNYVSEIVEDCKGRYDVTERVSGTYIVASLYYAKIEIIYNKLDFKGGSVGKHAFKYDPHRK